MSQNLSNYEKIKFLKFVAGCFSQYDNFDSDVCVFIASQFALESNFGTSFLALSFNNYCGMRKPKRRFTFASLVSSSGFAFYSKFEYCVFDYVLWLQYNRISVKDTLNLDRFKRFIFKHNYCPDSDYISRIEAIYNQFINNLNL